MVARSLWGALLILCTAQSSGAKSPQDQMFPDRHSCYFRGYSAAHLASHPRQRVTRISVSPDFTIGAPLLVVHVELTLRGAGGGAFEAYGYCENEGASTLYCGLEGDAGAFQISPEAGDGILVEVAGAGMSLENEAGFVTLERNSGDDRSFLLQPVVCR